MMTLTMSVLLFLANADEKVSFADLKKLAYDTVQAKEYPMFQRPTYKLENGTLYPSIPREGVIKAKDGLDGDTEVLRLLIRVAKFSTFPPKDMDAKLKTMIVAKAEKKLEEGVDHIRDKKLTGKQLGEYVAELDRSVDEILTEGTTSYAKAMKLKVGKIRFAPVAIPVKTNPKDGTVHCVPRYMKSLFLSQKKDPEIEVMRFVLSDEVPYAGWVYYVVTWDNGKEKGGYREIEITDENVTFVK